MFNHRKCLTGVGLLASLEQGPHRSFARAGPSMLASSVSRVRSLWIASLRFSRKLPPGVRLGCGVKVTVQKPWLCRRSMWHHESGIQVMIHSVRNAFQIVSGISETAPFHCDSPDTAFQFVNHGFVLPLANKHAHQQQDDIGSQD